ncbi:MAG: hypothetical protein HFJ80_03400 [Clostridiales bacterium]|nr:hypothetical protein [Clostridiales bacterium]
MKNMTRILPAVTRFLMWAVLAVYSPMQFLAAYGIATENNRPAMENDLPEKFYSTAPLITATLLMILSVILFAVWKKRPYIGLILGGISGLALLVIFLSMGRAFPLTTNAYSEYGLSLQKMVLCHYGFLLVPILMLLNLGLRRRASDQETIRDAAQKGRKWKHSKPETAPPRSSARLLHDPELNAAARRRRQWWKSKK